MKSFIFFLFLFVSTAALHAQTDTAKVATAKLYVITTIDGGEFVGTITSDDAREITIQTKDLGTVIIPKYKVKEIRELKPGELSGGGEYIADDIFAAHYFIQTNMLPVKKGEQYIQWNFWGIDMEFTPAENLSVGIKTTWVGVPLIGNVKYSVALSQKFNLGAGLYAGSGTWIAPRVGGVLPYASLTFGDRKANATFTAGYGAIFSRYNVEGRMIYSLSGFKKAGKKISLVFESFVMPPAGRNNSFRDYEGIAIVIPGLRIQVKEDMAFQFGCGGIINDREVIQVPVPVIQLFQRL